MDMSLSSSAACTSVRTSSGSVLYRTHQKYQLWVDATVHGHHQSRMVVELDATHDALHQLKEEAVRSGVLGRHLDELIDSILRVFSLEYPLQLWMKNECDVVDDPRAALARKLLDVPQWKWSRWERRPRVDDIQEVDDDDDEEYVKQVWSVDCLFWKHLHHLSLDEHELAILLHEFAPNTTHGGVAFVKRVTIEAVPC